MFSYYGILPPFNECLLYFFFGCLLARLIQVGIPLKSLLIRYILVSLACIVLVKALRYFVPQDLRILSDNQLLLLRLIPITSSLVLLFIVVFHTITSRRITSFFRNLGNMTYSVYLVHYPIQITIFLILRPDSYTVFNSPKILFLFLATSIFVGWIAYEYFEKPVQKYLRFKYSQRGSNKETAVAQATPYPEIKS
jgi:peptidoglycan/LPS O-acetylase OafA/YrhL